MDLSRIPLPHWRLLGLLTRGCGPPCGDGHPHDSSSWHREGEERRARLQKLQRRGVSISSEGTGPEPGNMVTQAWGLCTPLVECFLSLPRTIDQESSWQSF